MKLALAAVAMSVAVAAPALAADMPVKAAPAAYGWTGFYVGGNVGYARQDARFATGLTECDFVCAFNLGFDQRDLAAIQSNGSGSVGANGAAVGGQFGYNVQRGRFVFGGEVDFDWLRLKSSRTVTAPYTFTSPALAYTIATSAGSEWMSTVRGRAGWLATPSTLLFVTGGLTIADLNVANSFVDGFAPPDVGSSSSRKIRAGWTVGAGAEVAIARAWTVKLEYLHVDLGSVSTTSTITATGFLPSTLTTSAHVTDEIVRTGLNYRF